MNYTFGVHVVTMTITYTVKEESKHIFSLL